ncbi:hypothetical protein [Actinokineospora sp.]|uniref:hypothetical protein n=1 Tax=Actinokineospora sp. TaxID=1872133 RepID=UPI003D6A1744
MIAQRSSTLDDTDPVREWLSTWEDGSINAQATLAYVLAMTSTKSNLATDQKGSWSYDALGWREINRLITVMNRAIQREPAAYPGVTNVQQFAQRYLFDVLGMRGSDWGGSTIAYSLNSTTQDLSRLGLLLMQKGSWQGTQLLDEKFVYRMTHPAFEDTNTGYGYLMQMMPTRDGATHPAPTTPRARRTAPGRATRTPRSTRPRTTTAAPRTPVSATTSDSPVWPGRADSGCHCTAASTW